MAEQDQYGSHFGGRLPSSLRGEASPPPDPRLASGAEQDRWASHFGSRPTNPVAGDSTVRVPSGPRGSGAEQDRYGSHWSLRPENPVQATPGNSSWSARKELPSGAEQDRLGSHFSLRPDNPINATAVGILQSTLLPSFGLHSGLSVVAYTAGRLTDRAEVKDWAWPAGPVINAWWSAVGTRVYYDNLNFGTALSTLSYPEKLLLGGVTAWGTRLFYRIVTRSVARGKDDPRYDEEKKDPGFWNKAALTAFAPEALFQTIVSLPLVLPFRAPGASAAASPVPAYPGLAHDLAVFVFSTGFALEVLADSQLAYHRKHSDDLNRSGVWSIVRHPNYLGDTLVHASFPLILYSAGLLHPLALLGPVANYIFLRYVSGDRETEQSQEERYRKDDPIKYAQLQEYRRHKNSFWPRVQELTNPWTLAALGAGVGGVLLERGVREYFRA